VKKYLLCVALIMYGGICFAQTTILPGELWKHKRFYMGLRAGGSVHSYDTQGTAYSGSNVKNSVSFDGAVHFALQLTELFALQTELAITEDSAEVHRKNETRAAFGVPQYLYNTTYTFTQRSLLLPLLAKATFRPGRLSLAGFGGMYASVPLNKLERRDSFHNESESASSAIRMGLAIGGSAGIALADGVLFLDVRYLRDLGNSRFNTDIYKRNMLSIGIGIEMGFLSF
jgi:hypothetical protein